MREPHVPVGLFQKVGECLYRYSSNGVYYARIKSSGKEIRRSLQNTDAQGVIARHRASGDPRNRLGLGTCHRAAVVVSSSKCSLE
jgi:hypothetical protein